MIQKEPPLAKPYREIQPTLWWDGLSDFAKKEALKAVDAKDDEAGRRKAWEHHLAIKTEEANTRRSRGVKIPKR